MSTPRSSTACRRSSAWREDRPRDRARTGDRGTDRSRDRSVRAAGLRGVAGLRTVPGTVAPYTAGGVGLAGAAFALLRRFVRDPARAYVRVALVALALSWVPDLALLVIHEPGATVLAVASLMVMHGAAAAIVVTLLLSIARPSGVSGRW